MEQTAIHALLERQKAYFHSGKTLPLYRRREMLMTLRREISRREKEIADALQKDLGKSASESYMCEIGLARSQIRHLISHLGRLAAPRRVKTPLTHFPAGSFVLPSPYGTVLVMSPWNYPFLLTIDPLAEALAAGNTVVVKPSAYAPATSELLADLLTDCFAPEQVAVVTGGRAENSSLLEEKFDLIFFTGSQEVGREVLRRAASDPGGAGAGRKEPLHRR